MSNARLQDLARASGLSPEWIDYRGRPQRVADEVLRLILQAQGIACDDAAQIDDSLRQLREGADLGSLMIVDAGQPAVRPAAHNVRGSFQIRYEDGTAQDLQLDLDQPLPALPIGYHQLVCGDGRVLDIAAAPQRCFTIDNIAAVPQRKLWGLATQVYALATTGDGGIGHFGSVAALARAAAAGGADAIAISPVHAGFDAYPDHYGPYSPSSRFALNPVYADPLAVFDAAFVQTALTSAGLDAEYALLESLELIDWPRATRARARLHRALYAQLRNSSLPARADFEAFRRDCDPSLLAHARFEALHRHFIERDPPLYDWRRWPDGYDDASSPAIERYAAQHADEIDYHLFLQWLADRSLADAQRQARAAGMAVGLIGDLAIGTDAAGSHSWSRRSDMLMGVSIGAPPDMLNAIGQNWGLAAMSPRALRRNGYATFIELLRRNMRNVGGIRLDHVLGLHRLWLVPDGGRPTEGAYLQFPFDDLCRLVALESWRHRAIVIGEDLGTIPEGFRKQLAARGILGTDVMWYVREHGLYSDPRRWPSTAVAMASTHDLPTVAGWWQGRDLQWRDALKLYAEDDSAEAARAERQIDKAALWAAFVHAGIVDGPAPDDMSTLEIATAAAAFIGLSQAPLALLSI
ncbi:MAG TPA: 4-alpha-glucanotransferase, partial [Fontimonas sp.]